LGESWLEHTEKEYGLDLHDVCRLRQ